MWRTATTSSQPSSHHGAPIQSTSQPLSSKYKSTSTIDGITYHRILPELDPGIGLDRIVSIYEPENVASGRVMSKLGMTLERETTGPGQNLAVRVFEIAHGTWLRRRAEPAPAAT